MHKLLLVALLSGCVAASVARDKTAPIPRWAKYADLGGAGMCGAAAMIKEVTPDMRVAYGAMGLALGIAVVDSIAFLVSGQE